MEVKRQSNAWWEFVKLHKGDVMHIKDRKERFSVLAEMWKNEKAHFVYVTADYIADLHDNISKLRKEKAETDAENIRLKEMISYLTS